MPLPSTFINENGDVVGGAVDGDYNVYRVKGLNREIFNYANNPEYYKKIGTVIGRTYSLNSFRNPSTGEFMGHINYGLGAQKLFNDAKNDFNNNIRGNNRVKAFSHYLGNANNFQRYDLKTYNFQQTMSRSQYNDLSRDVRDAALYEGSYFSWTNNIIMSNRDVGNFFAGWAFSRMGIPLRVMQSGFGALQANGNQLGFGFNNYEDVKNFGTTLFYGAFNLQEGYGLFPHNPFWRPMLYGEDIGSADLQINGWMYENYNLNPHGYQ